MIDWKVVEATAKVLGQKLDADIFVYNGPIMRGHVVRFINELSSRKRRTNVVLILVTSGGDAHAAYKMARALQNSYTKVTVVVPGWCKSAGTLFVVGAHELVMGDLGEIGPIDVQRAKQDDLFESSSGLTEDAAISTLERATWKMFSDYVLEIKNLSAGKITFKTAAEVASAMVVGVFQPIFAQIDPLKIGENSRAMNIASDYGLRLDLESRNLRSEESIMNLVSGYPSHGFVIDRSEAEALFTRVRPFDKEVEEVCNALGDCALYPMDETKTKVMRYINPQKTTRSSPRRKARGRNQNATSKGGPSQESSSGGSANSGTAEGPTGSSSIGAGSNVAPLKRPKSDD